MSALEWQAAKLLFLALEDSLIFKPRGCSWKSEWLLRFPHLWRLSFSSSLASLCSLLASDKCSRMWSYLACSQLDGNIDTQKFDVKGQLVKLEHWSMMSVCQQFLYQKTCYEWCWDIWFDFVKEWTNLKLRPEMVKITIQFYSKALCRLIFLVKGWIKKVLCSLKFNARTCRHIQRDFTATCYPKPNPNHKRALNAGPEILTIILKSQSNVFLDGLWL